MDKTSDQRVLFQHLIIGVQENHQQEMLLETRAFHLWSTTSKRYKNKPCAVNRNVCGSQSISSAKERVSFREHRCQKPVTSFCYHYWARVFFSFDVMGDSDEPGSTRVKSSLAIEGHQYFSICSTTSSVPRV